MTDPAPALAGELRAAAQSTCRSMVGRRAWDLSPMVIQGGAGAGVQQRMGGRASLVRISEMAMDPRDPPRPPKPREVQDLGDS